MRLLYVVAKAEYFLSHRLALAKEAKAAGIGGELICKVY